MLTSLYKSRRSLRPRKMPAPKMPSHHTGVEQCSLFLTSGHLPSEQLAYSKPWSIIVGFLNPEVRCNQGTQCFGDFEFFFLDHISTQNQNCI